MRKIASILCALTALAFLPAAADPPVPLNPTAQDPLGTISDVTADWLHYQPAEQFCVRPSVFEFPADDTGAYVDGNDSACQFSGFPAGTQKVYYKYSLSSLGRTTPELCAGCRRIFIDFSKIPATNSPPYYYAHGHAYYRFQSYNFTYTASPYAHSPNTKNFTNDKLVVPEGSTQEPFVHGFDVHAMSYTTDTANFAHIAAQGPWYVGPWYVNRDGERIPGIYLDIDVMSGERFGGAGVDEIWYQTGFNSGEQTCLDNNFTQFKDGNYLYGGCFDRMGQSSVGVDPWR